MINKPELLARIVTRLQTELELLTTAALATHAEATDEENKAEDKYDTRGLEASYLAHGQSKAAEETALALAQFQALVLRDFAANEPIGLGPSLPSTARPAISSAHAPAAPKSSLTARPSWSSRRSPRSAASCSAAARATPSSSTSRQALRRLHQLGDLGTRS